VATPLDDAGRRERFEALVAAAYVPLQRYVRRRSDPSAADDVLSDVLLVMWRRVDEIPTDAQLPWCYGVARGCLANAARGARRHRRLLRRIAWQPEPTSAQPSDDPDLEQALAALPMKDQELLHLWAWEQLAPREIAAVLDITPNAASIRLHRATRRLRDHLAAERKDSGGGGQLDRRQGTEAPGDWRR
jgi:RNA polymerase sigma-70 factor (ECF subfamily)